MSLQLHRDCLTVVNSGTRILLIETQYKFRPLSFDLPYPYTCVF